MNVWFTHSHSHKPVCEPSQDALSGLDQYKFSDDKEKYEEEEAENEDSLNEIQRSDDGRTQGFLL